MYPVTLVNPNTHSYLFCALGLACSRRILWEHTRGRYTCVQCGHVVTNRKEMTLHISSKHSTVKAVEDTGSSATNT